MGNGFTTEEAILPVASLPSPVDKTCYKIIEEIIKSEKSYVHSLEMCLALFVSPIMDAGFYFSKF